MPGKKHLKGVSSKEQRQYEHIKESAQKSGRYGKRAKEVAARAVMKKHKKHGHAKGRWTRARAWRRTAAGGAACRGKQRNGGMPVRRAGQAVDSAETYRKVNMKLLPIAAFGLVGALACKDKYSSSAA